MRERQHQARQDDAVGDQARQDHRVELGRRDHVEQRPGRRPDLLGEHVDAAELAKSLRRAQQLCRLECLAAPPAARRRHAAGRARRGCGRRRPPAPGAGRRTARAAPPGSRRRAGSWSGSRAAPRRRPRPARAPRPGSARCRQPSSPTRSGRGRPRSRAAPGEIGPVLRRAENRVLAEAAEDLLGPRAAQLAAEALPVGDRHDAQQIGPGREIVAPAQVGHRLVRQPHVAREVLGEARLRPASARPAKSLPWISRPPSATR